MPPLLALQDVRIRYGTREVVSGFSLSLSAGEILGLSGESGCGKSSVLRYAAGHVSGRVGYISQDLLASLSPFLTVGEHAADVPGAEALLDCLGLTSLANSYPHQLSGGERQRVLVALALGAEPALILADEPTAHLDRDAERTALHLFASQVARTGAALLIASHSERVFRELGCRVQRMTPAPVPAEAVVAAKGGAELLTVRGLRKEYFRRDWLLRERLHLRALSDVSLTVRTGETVALMGPSGAGKSTLAHCIAGRERWEAGMIHVRGGVQLVPQEPSESLNANMTIAACFREACGTAESAMLESMALPGDWLERKTSALSEGQRARVAIGRSMAALRGGLLILDESLSGLDPATRRHVLAHVAAEQERTGLGCLLITHDEDVAYSSAGRVVRMESGRVVE